MKTFWTVTASTLVLGSLVVAAVWLFHSLSRIGKIIIPYYRNKRREYFLTTRQTEARKNHPVYLEPPKTSLDPDDEEDEF